MPFEEGGAVIRRLQLGRPAGTPGRADSVPAQPARPAGAISRGLDVVLASTVLVLLGPVLVLIAVLIKVGSPGPVIFKQVRMGYLGRPFVMWKFRTMYLDCPDAVHREFVSRMLHGEDPRQGDHNGLYKLQGDRRVTPIGRILRATSADELPQLINVLRGEMALVGPRPALDWEVKMYQPHHHERFLVRPGVTGLWQVSGRNRLTMTEALELDVEYARRRSIGLDFWILLRTLPAVVRLGAA